MPGITDAATPIRLLNGLEYGGMQASEARTLAQDLDPVLVFAVVCCLGLRISWNRGEGWVDQGRGRLT